MDYEASFEFSGDPQKALHMAQAVFVQAGYKIVDLSGNRILAKHEGGFVRSLSGHALYGASPVEVAVSGQRLVVRAQYEGIEKAKKFLVRLLLGLAALLGLGLGLPFGLLFEQKWPMLLGIGLGVGIPMLQLPIHLLVTPRIMKKRAIFALDTLGHNITM